MGFLFWRRPGCRDFLESMVGLLLSGEGEGLSVVAGFGDDKNSIVGEAVFDFAGRSVHVLVSSKCVSRRLLPSTYVLVPGVLGEALSFGGSTSVGLLLSFVSLGNYLDMSFYYDKGDDDLVYRYLGSLIEVLVRDPKVLGGDSGSKRDAPLLYSIGVVGGMMVAGMIIHENLARVHQKRDILPVTMERVVRYMALAFNKYYGLSDEAFLELWEAALASRGKPNN